MNFCDFVGGSLRDPEDACRGSMGAETKKGVIDCFVYQTCTRLLHHEDFEWKASEFGLSAGVLGVCKGF